MESFPDANTISKQSDDSNNDKFNKELKIIKNKIEEASKRGNKSTCVLLDHLDDRIVSFLKDKGYTVKDTKIYDIQGFYDGTIVDVEWV